MSYLVDNLEYFYYFDEKCKIYVSFCPFFDLYSQGETIKEALEAIKDAVKCMIENDAHSKSRWEQWVSVNWIKY